MSTVEELIRSDRRIRASAESLGSALAAVETFVEPALARAVQAEHNLYEGIDAEFGLLTASDAGRLMGSRSRAPRNLAATARRDGRLLAIQRGSQALFPGFQFAPDGQPLPVVARLRELAECFDRTESGVVQWLCVPTTYLDGQRPVDVLAAAPDRVLDVAQRAWSVEW